LAEIGRTEDLRPPGLAESAPRNRHSRPMGPCSAGCRTPLSGRACRPANTDRRCARTRSLGVEHHFWFVPRRKSQFALSRIERIHGAHQTFELIARSAVFFALALVSPTYLFRPSVLNAVGQDPPASKRLNGCLRCPPVVVRFEIRKSVGVPRENGFARANSDSIHWPDSSPS